MARHTGFALLSRLDAWRCWMCADKELSQFPGQCGNCGRGKIVSTEVTAEEFEAATAASLPLSEVA